MGDFVAMFLTIRYGTARFQDVKYKASSTPFPYIGPPPYSSEELFQIENGAKIKKIFETCKYSMKQILR